MGDEAVPQERRWLSDSMKSDAHVSGERIRQFMLDSLKLTEEESEHLNGWSCRECQATMRRVMNEVAESESSTEL